MAVDMLAPALPALRVTDLETGETLELSASCSTEDAYHNLLNLRAFQRAMAAIGDRWEAAIAADMAERGATERWVGNVLYSFKPGSEWVVDPDGMVEALRELVEAGDLPEAEFGRAVSYPPVAAKINNTVLNQLGKLGTRVAEAIEAHRRRIETAPKLVAKRQVQA